MFLREQSALSHSPIRAQLPAEGRQRARIRENRSPRSEARRQRKRAKKRLWRKVLRRPAGAMAESGSDLSSDDGELWDSRSEHPPESLAVLVRAKQPGQLARHERSLMVVEGGEGRLEGHTIGRGPRGGGRRVRRGTRLRWTLTSTGSCGKNSSVSPELSPRGSHSVRWRTTGRRSPRLAPLEGSFGYGLVWASSSIRAVGDRTP
jgi:hypothetical protein